jgi:DNA-directed RNA polymerase specialized sigma24 family protein
MSGWHACRRWKADPADRAKGRAKMAGESKEGTMDILCYEARCTNTETKVLQLYADRGMSYEEIAKHLGLSVHAVDCHAGNAGRKIRDHIEACSGLRSL